MFILSVAATSRMTAPSGAIVVAKSGGTYTTITEAVDSLSATTTSTQIIFIEEGTYNEQVYIPSLVGELIIYGQTKDTSDYASNLVIVTNDIGLSSVDDDDETATLRNYAENSKIYNINVANTHGKGEQALALSAYATNQGYYACQFTGYQDTVLAEIGNQIYAKCLIEGAVDFIFGQHATAWFDDCDIRVLSSSVGTITANGRSSSSDVSFYVINKSKIAAADDNSVSSGSYYLGRPWSEYARVVFQYTSMTDVINSAGWEEWSSSDPRISDVYFEEYDNTGEGASGTRASFAKKLTSPIEITTILGSNYKDWVDTDYLS
ncbi:pectin methylesterase [Talaromyces proteolyticus]|uniref:Pectinesterase n=1 Tax=Talaromyces proteolyticus TaxID=1131652 RepID=A0AAD4KIX5_9EURO|nr:pectin methylesterase [Talaromyces proteolyticus]KAH8689378.1 pectin methylesterase [Talaromyces proteolyticus]